MRIAYFTDTPPGIGGAERHLADMALAAIDGGHDVTLMAPQDAVVEYLRERVRAAVAIRVGSDRYHYASGPARRAAALVSQVASLRSQFRAVQADVLHVNNGGYPGSDLCRIAPLAGRLAGLPVRVMTVNSFPWSRDYLSSRSVQSVADAVVWGNLDAVLCPALIVMKGLTDDRGMPRALGRLLRYGVEEPPFEPGEEDALRGRLAPGGGPLVGMVSARADKGKGYEVFVEALARVDGLRGVLVGPHPGEEFVAHVDRLGLGERLALEGPQRPVWPYYAAMDALVVPSTEYECMPFVILEAMAIGRPAIGSHLSGIPEAIADGETGRTFPPGDVDGLAAILSDLVSSREAWRRMGAAARRRYERHFTWTKMRSELISLYASLAGSEDSQLTAGGGSRPADMSSPTDAGDAPRARSA